MSGCDYDGPVRLKYFVLDKFMKGTAAPAMQAMNEPQTASTPTALELLGEYLNKPAVLLCMLGLVTLVLYSGTIFFEFVWDDGPQIVNNPLIRSWHNLPHAFGTDLWYHVARQQVYYRPLFVVWSMLNFSLFALRPWGWHLGAILVHVGAVLSVFWFARKLGREYWTAAAVALIFALHPVHIEPVAWISAASDSMVTMFAALAFGAFLSARQPDCQNRTGWRLASLALLACALLTKEMALTFAVLIAIYAWMNPAEKSAAAGRRLWWAGREALPFALLTLAYALVRKHALLNSKGAFDPTHSMLDVCRTLPMVLSVYLEKVLVPTGLSGLYYTPYVTSGDLWHIVAPAVLLAVVAAALWYWSHRTRDPVIGFAGWWLLIGLAPALYLRNFGNGDFVRDRYMYLPSIGFALLAATAIRQLPSIRKWNAKLVQVGAVSALCVFYAVASLSQQVQWGSDFLELLRGQELYPGNPYTMVGLAAEYSHRGANEKAIEIAEKAAREHPEYVYAGFALAETYVRAGRFAEGRFWLEKSLKQNPDYDRSETGMAAMAGLYGRMGDFQRAFAYCDQALAKDPNLYSTLYNCGNIHLMAGRYSEAQSLLYQAIQTAPEQAPPKHYLGRALLQGGKTREAVPYLAAAVAMDPTVWDYHYWLAEALVQTQDLANARIQYEKALRLNPDSSEAKLRLAALEGK